MKEFNMLAKTYFGLEDILAKELTELGANEIETERRAVRFKGDKALLYKANLCLRSAIRILVPIAQFKATDADEVYEKAKKINWEEYIGIKQSFIINETVNSENFRHSKFVAYRLKDAIADYFTELYDKRPSVSITSPDIYIDIHISHNECTISLDSSGVSLHKRGYRNSQNEAPISEAQAAGMLLMAGWDGSKDFIDPMCGSGTFLIEAALIALNIPPCIYRTQFAFEKWKDFDKELFDDLYNDDSEEREFTHKIIGYDVNPNTVKIAQENIKAAGLSKYIEVQCRDIANFEEVTEPSLIVTNPPYGERLKPEDLRDLYREIGRALKHKFVNGEAWVISSHAENLAAIGLKPSQRVELKNGALDCEFWKFEIFSGTHKDFKAEGNKLTKSFEVTKKKFDKKKPFVSDKKFDENKPRNKKYYDSERKSERKDDKKARIKKDDKRVKTNQKHNDKYDSSKLKKGSQEYEMQKYSKLIKKLDL
ncbi:MAG: THUMP domain-containing protein [Bacteroidales bacterium]|nr:THUMP domain-containing protein [Bacteroidales bacterium]MDY5193382.1 THUMP domain-containing protein [Candidatus Aphodosoma sp.]